MSDLPRRVIATAFCCCVLTTLLLASGRMASSDAGNQYHLAELLVRDGQISLERPPTDLWLKGVDGKFYNVHDLGNSVLMLPTAVLSSIVDPSSDPGLPSHVEALAVSLTYALLSGIGLGALFLAVNSRIKRPRASLAIVGFTLFGTIYGAYEKAALDVLGATATTCVALALLVKVADRPRDVSSRSALLALGGVVGCVGWFRFTFMPFLLLGVLLVILANLPRRDAVSVASKVLAAAMVVLIPSLIYNAIRTGNPLLPHTASYERAGGNVSGDLVSGLVYYLVSPKKGLFFFSPVLLLVFVHLFGRFKQRGGRAVRAEANLDPLLIGCVLYAAFIAIQSNRDPAFWGARYLLPVIPCLVLVIAGELARVRRGVWRAVFTGAVALSLFVGTLPMLTAWNDDVNEFRPSVSDASMWSLAPQRAVVTSIINQVTGADRYTHGFVFVGGVKAAQSQAFPDFWWRQAMNRGKAGAAGGIVVVLLLLSLLVISVRTFLRITAPPVHGEKPGDVRETQHA